MIWTLVESCSCEFQQSNGGWVLVVDSFGRIIFNVNPIIINCSIENAIRVQNNFQRLTIVFSGFSATMTQLRALVFRTWLISKTETTWLKFVRYYSVYGRELVVYTLVNERLIVLKRVYSRIKNINKYRCHFPIIIYIPVQQTKFTELEWIEWSMKITVKILITNSDSKRWDRSKNSSQPCMSRHWPPFNVVESLSRVCPITIATLLRKGYIM